VRLRQFAEQFGGNGTTFSICDTDYTMSLSGLATKLSGPPLPPWRPR
jgi:hypothetical protein